MPVQTGTGVATFTRENERTSPRQARLRRCTSRSIYLGSSARPLSNVLSQVLLTAVPPRLVHGANRSQPERASQVCQTELSEYLITKRPPRGSWICGFC